MMTQTLRRYLSGTKLLPRIAHKRKSGDMLLNTMSNRAVLRPSAAPSLRMVVTAPALFRVSAGAACVRSVICSKPGRLADIARHAGRQFLDESQALAHSGLADN
jgi:hypothetical protein